MIQSIRDAAQALLDATTPVDLNIAHAQLRAALAAPAPTDDERVYEHMVKVGAVAIASHRQDYSALDTKLAVEAVEASARALLATAQQDAEMLDWLDANLARFNSGWNVGVAPAGNVSITRIAMGGQPIREAIRAAMKEAK